MLNVNAPAPPPSVSPRNREEEACDAIAAAVNDVANAARHYHRVVVPGVSLSDFAPADKWMQGSLADWNDVKGKNIDQVSHMVADAAEEVVRLAGLVHGGASDPHRGKDPVLDYRYGLLEDGITEALRKMEFRLRERLAFIRRTP